MWKRLDDGLAKGEAAVAGLFLLAMIVLAVVQVVVDNSAVRGEMAWAQEVKLHLGWIDNFLERATVILAFLGASLAVHSNKHIAVDALVRILPSAARAVTLALSMILAGVICYFLARVFYQAALGAAMADAQERALDVYLLGEIHVCDGTADAIEQAGLERPDTFCQFRAMLAQLGLERTVVRDGVEVTVPAIDVPDALLRFVVPVMLLVMSIRFVLRGLGTFARSSPDGEADPRVPPGVSEADASEGSH